MINDTRQILKRGFMSDVLINKKNFFSSKGGSSFKKSIIEITKHKISQSFFPQQN